MNKYYLYSMNVCLFLGAVFCLSHEAHGEMTNYDFYQYSKCEELLASPNLDPRADVFPSDDVGRAVRVVFLSGILYSFVKESAEKVLGKNYSSIDLIDPEKASEVQEKAVNSFLIYLKFYPEHERKSFFFKDSKRKYISLLKRVFVQEHRSQDVKRNKNILLTILKDSWSKFFLVNEKMSEYRAKMNTAHGRDQLLLMFASGILVGTILQIPVENQELFEYATLMGRTLAFGGVLGIISTWRYYSPEHPKPPYSELRDAWNSINKTGFGKESSQLFPAYYK